MTDNGAHRGLNVTCPQCQFTITLTQDEIVVFYTNFFCLKCGKRAEIPVSKEEYAKLRVQNDRDRQLPGLTSHGRDTMKHVR